MKKITFFIALGLFLCFCITSQASVWQIEVPDSSGTSKGRYCSLAIDSKGNPHIAYYDEDFMDLRYAYCRDGIWTIDVVDSILDAGAYCSLALDSQDRPHISYRAQYWSSQSWTPSAALKYTTLTDSGWYKVLVDLGGYFCEDVRYTSIAINAKDFPCISYYIWNYESVDDLLKYTFKDEMGWHNKEVYRIKYDSFALFGTKLVLKNGNIPIIGFHEDEMVYFGGDRFRYAQLIPSDSTWKITTLPDEIFSYASYCMWFGFDINRKNEVYCVYVDSANSYLRLAVHDGLKWNIEDIVYLESFENPGISLKLNKTEEPCIIFITDDHDVHYLTKSNGQWYDNFAYNSDYYEGFEAPSSLAFNMDNFPGFAIRGSLSTDEESSSLFYFRYWPGNPQIVLSQPSHDFGAVWTQSYSDWDCPISNQGDAPLVIHKLKFDSYKNYFQARNISIPKTILPQNSDIITLRFDPSEEKSYQDNLTIYSNDSLHLEEKIALQGRGTASGTIGNLSLTAQNCYVDQPHNSIKSDLPLVAARISLYQNSQLKYGPVPTGGNGRGVLDNIAVGNYDLEIAKDVSIPGDEPGKTLLETLSHTTAIEIGPGTNSKTIVFPESLMVEKYHHIYNLTHINPASTWNYPHTFEYRNEAEVKNLLNFWKADLPSDLQTSASRLILAEDMTHQMFIGAGHQICEEFVHDTGELINMIFYSDNWLDSIWEILEFLWDLYTNKVAALMRVLNAFMKTVIVNLIGEGVQQAAAELPVPGEAVVMTAWENVESQYSAWGALLPGFSSTSWNEMKGLIYNDFAEALIQGVYIDILTEGQIDKAKDHSENFQFNGEFSHASQDVSEFIQSKRSNVEYQMGLCEDLRVTAKLFYMTGGLLELAGEIPNLGLLGEIGETMKIAAYLEVISAMGISAHTFFSLPDDMDKAVDNIYFPNGRARLSQNNVSNLMNVKSMPRAKLQLQMLTTLKANLLERISDYDATLTEIKNQIISGNTENALLQLEDLMNAENNLVTSFKVTCTPIYSVANYAGDSLADFSSMYDSLRSSFSDAGEERFKDYIYIMFLPADTSQAMRDNVLAQIDRSIDRNHILTDQIIETLDNIAILPLPAILVANQATQDVYELKSGESATIQVQIQNVGAISAEDVSLVISTNPAIQVSEADSIYIGKLAPGEKSSVYKWTVTSYLTSYSRGYWTVAIHSSKAKTYSPSGSFVTESSTNVTAKTSPPTPSDYKLLQNYPNPFNPNTTIEYHLPQIAAVELIVYDLQGRKVRELLHEVKSAGCHKVQWDGRDELGQSVASGIYFCQIKALPKDTPNCLFTIVNKLILIK